MKYSVSLLILSVGLLLSGYAPGPSKTETARQSKTVTAADVHEDGDLTKRELRIVENNLNSMEYYGFLLSDFSDPKYIDWNEVFYNGADLKEVRLTKTIEKEYLTRTGEDEIYTDLTILAAEDIEDYVKLTTGLPYSKMRNPLDWLYLKKYDIYLFEHGDTNYVSVEVISGDVEDGVYTIRYQHNNWWGSNADCEYEVCFTVNDDYYRFISNTPDLKTKGKGEYIFPESNVRNLKESDLIGKDAATLRIGRNEIYARHGRKFKDSALQTYFNAKSWYIPSNEPDSKIEGELNQYEKKNIQFILAHEGKSAG